MSSSPSAPHAPLPPASRAESADAHTLTDDVAEKTPAIERVHTGDEKLDAEAAPVAQEDESRFIGGYKLALIFVYVAMKFRVATCA